MGTLIYDLKGSVRTLHRRSRRAALRGGTRGIFCIVVGFLEAIGVIPILFRHPQIDVVTIGELDVPGYPVALLTQ